jgi:hypothetical protein
MQNKHYELLATRVTRYIKNVDASPEEIGKAIEMIYKLIEREAERDSRQEKNK